MGAWSIVMLDGIVKKAGTQIISVLLFKVATSNQSIINMRMNKQKTKYS